MRTGVIASVVAHALILLVVLIGLNNAHALTPEEEQSISVDLVPSDTTSVRAGSEQSKIIDTDAPSIVQSDKPAVLAQPTGNTQQDQPKPTAADVPTPTPTTNTAPAPAPTTPSPAPQPVVPAPPPPQPQPKPQPAPQPQPAPEPKPAPQPTPQPTAPAPLPELAAENAQSPDSAPPVQPAPATQTASLEQKRAEFKKQQDAAAKAAADAAKAASDAAAKAAADAAAQAKADAAAKAIADAADQAVADAAAAQAKKDAAAKKLALAKQAEAAAKAADQISSLINNDKTTGAKTGQGGTPTAGKANGTAAKLSKGEMDAFAAQVKQCFHLLPNEIESGQVVDLLVTMNQDGSVNGTPSILKADSSGTGGSIARAGQRAVMECGPYKLPSAKFDDWKQIDLELDAQDN